MTVEDLRITLLETTERDDTARVSVLIVTVYGSGPLGADEYESEEAFELVKSRRRLADRARRRGSSRSADDGTRDDADASGPDAVAGAEAVGAPTSPASSGRAQSVVRRIILFVILFALVVVAARV